ncbi:barstar family protein [Gordonia polyisoprenivorans]|uniref:barstar family protein n=1 Tax=Gordonia polyisoprenivorans TaxID=84595 RepID=UPI001AD698C2|nr:barstar family protein [Gordonia polyisoprenivorans]QTI70238.1 barstar family protein [Gordonia polyisoprenivorans]
MTAQRVSLQEFLIGAAGHGPAVGLIEGPEDMATVDVPRPDDFRVRVIAGTRLTTRPDVFDEFARSWRFPDHFGRNADAFDDCMRDLDQPAGITGFLTVLTDAQHVLPHADDTFTWFARSLVFYRDHYRDFADPPATFAVLLSTPVSARRATLARWRATGIAVASVIPDS